MRSDPALHCPLCDSVDVPLFHSYDKRQSYHCAVCDLVFVPKAYHVSVQEERAVYLLHENHIENEGYVAMFRRALAEIMPHVTPRRILDYGCGYEPVLQQILQGDGYHCDIYDAHFFPELPDGEWDLIVSTEAFEHFANPAAEIERMLSRLQPGGSLGIMTRLRTEAIEFASWHYSKDPTHITFYSPACFEWIAARYNLRVVHSDNRAITVLAKA